MLLWMTKCFIDRYCLYLLHHVMLLSYIVLLPFCSTQFKSNRICSEGLCVVKHGCVWAGCKVTLIRLLLLVVLQVQSCLRHNGQSKRLFFTLKFLWITFQDIWLCKWWKNALKPNTKSFQYPLNDWSALKADDLLPVIYVNVWKTAKFI